ncbi:helix-turn-helix domain-containing protein [Cytobacillus spongiae]|uniref:helix-turn-helix domain-containing protein n=1 Tax=Cytobacillus spongiae TaxID=2901381 RepID=UPI001F2C3DCD|nr:helix-turn-helix domain-containing protein [Cytobacillus spongiae]UII55920.1 helix-turn-helix domain-containing protein [Cytobacillus spongiae]
MSKRAYSVEEKYEILTALDKQYSPGELESKYNVHRSTILDWKHKFDKYGFEGLKESSTWKKYSKELKLAAIRDYLSGKYSIREIVELYEISSTSVLRRWIKKYNSHRDIKDTAQGRTSSMTKGRKTTWEERVHIVMDCLGNGKDYQKAADTYQVSYQQVYQWVKKFEDGGDEALKDKRGKKKEDASLTPVEKISLHMKKLERENERLRAENLFLKKLEECDRQVDCYNYCSLF